VLSALRIIFPQPVYTWGAFKKKGILALKGSNIPAQGNSLNTVELRIKF